MLLPDLEAAPVELARGSHLVRKTEIVEPAFLFGAPAAAPVELESLEAAWRGQLDSSDKVRATRLPGDRHLLDVELGMVVKHVIEQARDLDPRGIAADFDAVGGAGLEVPDDVALEGVGRPGLRKETGELWVALGKHKSNILGVAASVYWLVTLRFAP